MKILIQLLNSLNIGLLGLLLIWGCAPGSEGEAPEEDDSQDSDSDGDDDDDDNDDDDADSENGDDDDDNGDDDDDADSDSDDPVDCNPSHVDPRALAKYEPAGDCFLVFAGQDNLSVGANAPYTDGYIERVDVPAGISHYMPLHDDSPHPSLPEGKRLLGMYRPPNGAAPADWGAGPICLECYLTSSAITDQMGDSLVIHLSINLAHQNDLQLAADGHSTHLIDELADYLNRWSEIPFLLRIGYEFDGEWNGYEATLYKKAWINIVDRLRERNVTNFATVMASWIISTPVSQWEAYYPGSAYVDWLGFSYWGAVSGSGTIDFAEQVDKPVMVAESAPKGYMIQEAQGESQWDSWYRGYFELMETHRGRIKALAYINANWEAQPLWQGQGWGDTRIQNASYITDHWRQKMDESQYITAKDDVYDIIRFNP